MTTSAARYGTMHVVATNIVLWIRTLIKETMEEVTEIGEQHSMKESKSEHYMVRSSFVHLRLRAFQLGEFFRLQHYFKPWPLSYLIILNIFTTNDYKLGLI